MTSNRRQSAQPADARSLSAPPPTAENPVRIVSDTHAAATFIRPHSHDAETQVLVPLSGVVRVDTDAALWIVPPGKAIVIPAGTSHAVSAPGSATLCVLRLHPSAWSPAQAAVRAIAVSRLMLALVEAAAALSMPVLPETPDARLIAVLLDQLHAAPADGFHVRRPRDARLRRIVEALTEDPGNPSTLAAWGRATGASERTLARLFDAEIGMGFRDCRRTIQMHSAVARLSEGHSLADIAADLGYESLSAFIHAFRSVIGETPGQMARRLAPATPRSFPFREFIGAQVS